MGLDDGQDMLKVGFTMQRSDVEKEEEKVVYFLTNIRLNRNIRFVMVVTLKKIQELRS